MLGLSREVSALYPTVDLHASRENPEPHRGPARIPGLPPPWRAWALGPEKARALPSSALHTGILVRTHLPEATAGVLDPLHRGLGLMLPAVELGS